MGFMNVTPAFIWFLIGVVFLVAELVIRVIVESGVWAI